jgi:hypothetical protein
MGFGTLFVGYFLLLNLTYYGFTDLIAAAVMLLGLYKLSGVNQYFKSATVATAVFLAFSLGEFGVAVYEIFVRAIGSATLVSVMSIARCIIIGVVTVFMLRGIEAVAREVDVENLPRKASRLIKVTAVVYSAWIILEAPLSFINDYVLAVLSLFTILATIALLIANLTAIYSAYMRICMPGDENAGDKPSRFGFVNEYRSRKAEREREAEEERIKLLNERARKKKGNKK